MPIPPEVTAIHHITDSDVKDKPTFREHARLLADTLTGHDFAAYNHRFDRDVLTAEFERAGVPSPFVNAMEMMRSGIWGNQVTAYYNIWNPIGCSAVLILLGLTLCRRVRRTLAIE